MVGFPAKEFQVCVVLAKEGQKKYFKLYNIFAERFERKFKKKPLLGDEEEKETGEESDAFEVHPSANFLVYC